MVATNEQLEARVAELERVIGALKSALGGGAPSIGGDATDAELDGKYGNPKIKFDPKRWIGPRFKGRLASMCDPAFLDVYADTLEYLGQKNADAGEADKAKYDRLDARRVRGWARRLRAGWKPRSAARAPDAPARDAAPSSVDDPYAPRGDEPYDATDDEIPFIRGIDRAPRHERARLRWQKF